MRGHSCFSVDMLLMRCISERTFSRESHPSICPSKSTLSPCAGFPPGGTARLSAVSSVNFLPPCCGSFSDFPVIISSRQIPAY
ncbi:hypothetical protein F2P81_001269 [Scophthalmus maximus]|uniref:Uncharacterized protein n=1 Tax=Scophthalmus maximus TaxID=52904 RepID=A0A6A4TJB8_SCOMX|nr:hypothetical protein F2P81_001269 [Scophthalmus maximus]